MSKLLDADNKNNQLLKHLHSGLLIRGTEERLLRLFSEGKLFGTVHTCIGQELTGVAIANALVEGDIICSNHRCHGHYIARTDDVEGLIAEIMGKQTGMCGGRGGSQHICNAGFFSNGVQGGMTAVGAGLAMSLKKLLPGRIAVVFIGDGTLGEGLLYETLNIASKWDLPLMIVIENNLYAQSTSQIETLSGDILDRAKAFGIRTAHSDTWNLQSLVQTSLECTEYVRSGKPLFFRIDTYRLMAHSKGDDDRSKEEVAAYSDRDPLNAYLKSMQGETADVLTTIQSRLDDAVLLAESAPFTSEFPTLDEVPSDSHIEWTDLLMDNPDRQSSLIHSSLKRNMDRDDRITMIGEDIEGPYGGAFKVTKNLSLDFPSRVRNTPISEGAIVGIGNGLALGGMIPVVEIMFGDFLTLCSDQWINHSSKFQYMYNNKVSVPLIIRTPMGGKRGYGATHSQSLEKHFMGLPGTQVLAINSKLDPGKVYDILFQTLNRPTLVIENKMLYALKLTSDAPEGFIWQQSNEIFPSLRLLPGGTPDISLFCYGGMLPDAEKAVDILFEQHEIIAELICPTMLYPFNPWPLIHSLTVTNRLVVIEEGLSFCAMGSEIIAQVMQSAPGVLKEVQRVSSPRHPIPSCGPLEKAVLPGVDHIVDAVRKALYK